MPAARFTPEQIAARAQFSADDLAEIHKRRRDNNRLGFAYHLAFVRLANRFPAQQPLEVVDDLLSFVSIQLNIDAAVIATYEQRQQTMAEHRAALLDYLQLRRFEAEETSQLEAHLFSEACRLEQTGPLLVKAKHFLQENGILFPADGALRRLIGAQRRLAREYIYGRIATSLSDELREKLDALLLAGGNRLTPFQSLKCTDRDAAYVLDGLLYNESDLALEEHYTDTHGYTEINFAAFAMLGRRFAPRIRGLQNQRIYRIDKTKDYGPLTPLVTPWDRTIRMDWICEQWDRMGQFYASLESGHTTASTAFKRLAGYSGKNHFYRANRELGRIFKTEHILRYMSDPLARQQIRRGLLKCEEIHALARQVAYGKQGRLTARDLQALKNTSSCRTLIMACIIYWQSKEINRVILEGDPEAEGIDLTLLEHISPVGWDNVLLYGEYVLNRSLVKS
jgi:TnpA family transposase